MSTVRSPRDPNTLSNYHNFVTTHTKTDLTVDFDQKKLSGEVTLHLKSLTNAESKEILLDSSFIQIHHVSLQKQKAEWKLFPRFEPYGSALKVDLPKGIEENATVELVIGYETTEKCTALQWLDPVQTGNKKHPYVFSQCQAIHARSLFPCQDTPDVKSTFEFNIVSPLPVITSGLPTQNASIHPKTDENSKGSLYTFEQSIPIPAYLFAIASGDIVTAPIGPRSKVATGPEAIQASQWEFESDTERFIETAEKLVFPYAWSTYNVLVMPPSFPYGGMENPVYTFATPTLISGDRENVDVIAHELSHSWSGNLVSPASWEHFWLNEGWTTYLERRIQAAVHGEPHRSFSAIIGWKALSDSIEQFGADSDFTKLIIDLKGKDPDDAFSSVPYEKGFIFLYYLENLIGIEKWDSFIPHYFKTWARKSLDSYEFKTTLLDYFASDPEASKLLNDLDWDKWFYSPGFPPKPDFDTSLVDVCYDLAAKWKSISNSSSNAKTTSDSPHHFTPKKSDINGWSANQIVVFLEKIQQFESPLSADEAQKMGRVYDFDKSRNVEVVSRYYVIALKAKDESIYQPTVELLGKVGRMKFVRPLYRHLNQVNRDLALKTFNANRNFYHKICSGLVEKDLFG